MEPFHRSSKLYDDNEAGVNLNRDSIQLLLFQFGVILAIILHAILLDNLFLLVKFSVLMVQNPEILGGDVCNCQDRVRVIEVDTPETVFANNMEEANETLKDNPMQAVTS